MSRLTRRALGLAALAVLAGSTIGCAKKPTTGKENSVSDDEVSFSRIGPPDVQPVVFEGRRYEQVTNGEDRNLDQRTGYLAVIDTASEKQVAAIKVYEVPFDPDMEADVQDVFMITLQLQSGERRVLVENEHGGRYYVALDGYAVSPAP